MGELIDFRIKTQACAVAFAAVLVCAFAISLVAAPQEAYAATKLSSKTMTVHLGTSSDLELTGGGTSKTITWTTSNEKVATITKVSDTKVKVTARKKGKATIKVKVGKKTYKCEITVPKAKLKKTVSSTCSKKGKKVYYCYDCKKKYKVAIAKAAHSFELVSSTEPTCTESGSQCYECTVCGKQKTVAGDKALGHNWDDGLVVSAATYDSEGKIRYTCLRCWQEKYETIAKKADSKAPLSAEYKLDDVTSGLAAGTVNVKVPSSMVSNDNAIVMYWADANGKLTDYDSLAPQRITSEEMTITIGSNVAIPEGATQLWVYTSTGCKVNDGQWQGAESSAHVACDLPSGSSLDLSGDYVQFQVLSDIHLNQTGNSSKGEYTGGLTYFPKALADIAKNSPNSNTIIAGDIADSGSESEYRKMESFISAQSGISNSSVYLSIGNHDYYSGTADNPHAFDISEATQEAKRNLFKKYAAKATGVQFTSEDSTSLYYSVTLDGYKHIMLGSEKQINSVDAYLSDTQLEWFEEQLQQATAESSAKPIFVYLHQSIYDTISGSFSGQGWDGIDSAHTDVDDDSCRTKLISILQKYPQVILFDGHSHWDMNSIGNSHVSNQDSDGLPSIFNTASAAYLWSTYNDVNDTSGVFEEGSEGYYVRVYSDKVVVMGRDFRNGKYIPSAMYVISRN